MNKEQCLIMFARYPEKGKVKSRLGRHWDEDIVARLYRFFIEDLLERLSGGDYLFRLAYHPAEKKNDFIKQFGKAISYMPQIGENLGERMYNAFRRCFAEGFRSVVLIGSDSPDLPLRIIREAFLMIEVNDAVVGPSLDGGYYLIGFNRKSFLPGVFDGIAWGTDSVFRKTKQILQDAGIRLHELPARRDIDRPEDIISLVKDSEETDFANSKTMTYLKESGLMEIS